MAKRLFCSHPLQAPPALHRAARPSFQDANQIKSPFYSETSIDTLNNFHHPPSFFCHCNQQASKEYLTNKQFYHRSEYLLYAHCMLHTSSGIRIGNTEVSYKAHFLTPGLMIQPLKQLFIKHLLFSRGSMAKYKWGSISLLNFVLPASPKTPL